jgi:hypothetical protein
MLTACYAIFKRGPAGMQTDHPIIETCLKRKEKKNRTLFNGIGDIQ